MNRYFLNYIRENQDNDLSKKWIDIFKTVLDWKAYNSGNHLSPLYYESKNWSFKLKVIKKVQCLLARSSVNTSNNILSQIPSINNAVLPELGYTPYSCILEAFGRHNIVGDNILKNASRHMQKLIDHYQFHEIMDQKLFEEFEEYSDHTTNFMTKLDMKALIVGTGELILQKFLIDVFKKIDRPSFILTHGLPGIYSLDIDNNSDYLLVWGEKMKQNYVNVGFEANKIIPVGNAKYNNIPKCNNLRNSLDNILVIPISAATYHQEGWKDLLQIDPTTTILYLYQVQDVLQRIGVKKARFRPHPSIRIEWLYKFLDHDFYIPDREPLWDSLHQTTLAIGSVSTLLIEAFMAGVNYLVYEPCNDNGLNLFNVRPVPPFDNSEPGLEIAVNQQQLFEQMHDKYQNDNRFMEGYIQPFDLSILKQLI